MSNEILENVNTMGKNFCESVRALYEINVNIAGQISDQHIAFANLYVDYMASQVNLISAAKDYKEIVAAQSKLIGEISEKTQGIVRNTIDIFNESNDEVSAWVKKGVEETTAVIPFAKSA